MDINSTQPPPLTPEHTRGTEYYEPLGITYTEGSFVNSHGHRLFTTKWAPASGESKGLVFMCHGYGIDTSTCSRDTTEALALAGFTVYGLDYQGHGQSEGLRGMIHSVHDIVDDCIAYYGPIRDDPANAGKAKFLVGESMGGAVALSMHLREPEAWQGAVLIAPMCKVSEKFRPHPVAEFLLSKMAYVFSTWAIVPTTDLADQANENPEKRTYFKNHPMVYKGKPRLGSALACLQISNEMEESMEKVSIPFLLLHGDADTVTDPAVSKTLYEKSISKDKTFNLYPDMWHSMIHGAFKHNAEKVLQDIVAWLEKRSLK